jgi:hypothetical protein
VRCVEVESVREAVDLQGDAGLERYLDDPFDVESVRGSVVDQAAGRMAEAAHSGVSHRVCDFAGQRVSGFSLAGVKAELDPVELVEHIVRKIEVSVSSNVDLGTPAAPGTVLLPRWRLQSLLPGVGARLRRGRERCAH